MSRLSVFFIFFLSLIFFGMVGCGGSLSSAPATPTSTAAPAPTPTPSPSPTPTPTPGSNPDMFQAALLGANDTIIGHVQVNATANDGNSSVMLQGNSPSASFVLRFCPFDSDPSQHVPCYEVTTFTTDASGNAQASYHFPKSGTFFGTFDVQQNGNTVAVSGYTYTSTPDYHASIQAAQGTIDVTWQGAVGDDPLTSGHVEVSGTNLTVAVVGAKASSTYRASVCPNGSGSSCFNVGKFVTDSTGAATMVFDLNKAMGPAMPPETFYFFRDDPVETLEYVAGFKVQ